MKYGIKADFGNNNISYCSSTRSYSFSSNIEQIALFARKSSAEKAIKNLRKADYELKHSCTLSVVGIAMVVDAVYDVPYPPTQTGYVIKGEKWDTLYKRYYTVYFSGPKKLCADIQWTENFNSATIFPDEFDARERLQDSKAESVRYLAYREKERARISYIHNMRHDAAYHQKQQDELVKEAKDRIDWHDTLTIELVTR